MAAAAKSPKGAGEGVLDDHGPVRSVARAADILVALEDGPKSLGRISQRTGLSKPTAHRLLASLAYRQMVIQDPDTIEYMLGPGSLRIADAIMRGAAGIGALLMPILESLEASSGETAALYVRAGLERICIGQVPSHQPVRYMAHVGATYPLHAGAMGKVLLSFSDDGERRELLERLPLPALTEASITDRGQLEAEVDRIRELGYSTSHGERSTGVAAISAPVFGPDGRLLAALAILGPESRLSETALARLRTALLAAAAACTDRVRGQPDPLPA
jgi:IclR family KDG regulon transcriptional repressor